MVLIRFALIFLIAYLIIRSFIRIGEQESPADHKPGPDKSNKIKNKGVSKEIGEYIDYEEVDK
jgi:hypothetical protein